MVTHPPRVEPGLHAGFTTGLGVPNDSVLMLATTPQLGPYLRYGSRRDDGWAGAATVAVNAAAEGGLHADLYAEAPARPGRRAHGGGVVVAGNYLMPYLQLGAQDERGSGWYVTQGFAWRGWQDASACLMCGGSPDRVRTRYASTTFTLRRVRGARALELYATASAGRYDLVESFAVDTLRGRALWSVAAGLSAEANLRRLFSDVSRAPPTRRPPNTPPPIPHPVPIP
jgi:hypothetical protein